MPEMDQEKCNRCELCISVCACNAIVLVADVIEIIDTDECHWCTLCEAVCPTEAITCSFEIIIEQPLTD